MQELHTSPKERQISPRSSSVMFWCRFPMCNLRPARAAALPRITFPDEGFLAFSSCTATAEQQQYGKRGGEGGETSTQAQHEPSTGNMTLK